MYAAPENAPNPNFDHEAAFSITNSRFGTKAITGCPSRVTSGAGT
jgi:hypothetical protein